MSHDTVFQCPDGGFELLSFGGRSFTIPVSGKTVVVPVTVSTTVPDLSLSNHNGTLVNHTSKTTSGFLFDGTDDYISTSAFNVSWKAVLSNTQTYLNTPTYDGSGQACHPSVVYFSDGWNGYKYWMAMTPYPNSNDMLENPSILASNDGITWVVPAGLTNPIYPMPPGHAHNNDPDLIYNPDTDELWVFWLDTRRAIECPGYEAESWYNHQYLMMMKTSNGVGWSAPVAVIDWNLGVDLYEVSPSVVYKGVGQWELFTNHSSATSLNLYKRTSADGLSWSASSTIVTGEKMWHSEVRYIASTGEYLVVASQPSLIGDVRLQKSSDLITWTTYPNLLIKHGETSGAWDAHLYRTTFVYHSDTDVIEFWYSGHDASNVWHIAHISTDYSNLLTALDTPLGGVTLSAKVYINTSKQARIINKYLASASSRCFSLSLSATRTFTPEFWGYDFDNASAISANCGIVPFQTWTRITATFDGKTLKGYINKSKNANVTVSGTQIRQSTDTVSIGRYDGSGGLQYFDGKIDDIRIYERALSETEVSALVDGIEPNTAGKILHFKSSFYNSGSVAYELNDLVGASYNSQNMSKPWVAFLDPNGNVSYIVFTNRSATITCMRNSLGNVYEVIIDPGNSLVYRGNTYLGDQTTDSNSDGIPDILEETVEASIANALKNFSFNS